MQTFPYAWVFFVPVILVATVEKARDHIEADMHVEVQALREEIRQLRTLLLQ